MVSGLHGHPIAAELEGWFLRNAGQHDNPAWAEYLADFYKTLEEKLRELGRKHDNEGRFGMSKSGGCTRSAGMKLLGAKPEPFSGSTHVTFLIGHMVECMGIAALRSAGYKVEGQQQPARIDPMMHSFSDGIIEGIQGIKGPAILSVKSAGYKKSGKQGKGWVRRGFPELPFEGVRKAQPSWYAQVQAEMHGTGLGYALVLVVAKDIIKAMEADPYLGEGGNGSLTFFTEVIRYNPSFVASHLLPVWEETWAAVQSGKPGTGYYLHNERDEYVKLQHASTDWMPNAGATGTFNPCNYCDLLRDCRAQMGNWRNQ